MLIFSVKFRISIWWMTDCIGVRSRALLREHAVTDQTLAHVLTDDNENLANLVAGGGTCASLSVFVSSHVER
jgi:hypothetical protein